MKRLVCFVITTFLLLAVGYSESSFDAFTPPQKVEYVGGGILFRTGARDSTSTDIEVAYWDFDMPYIILGKEARWDVAIEGGQEPYTISATLYRQEFSDSSLYYSFYDMIGETNKPEICYTFSEEGRYLWMINISDAAGQQVVIQTKMIPVYAEGLENDESTVPGKINSIITSVINDNMDDYHRALALHDWLVTNAEYDYTYTYYEPEGVLLYGTGVCDSFAQAYRMLMNAAGVECIYVSGISNDDRHAWNLVKIDGEWYHVDCTWDVGGSHEYFMLTDEQMESTHIWKRDFLEDDILHESVVPDAEGGDHTHVDNGADVDYYEFIAYDLEDLSEKFLAFVSTGKYAEVHFSNETEYGIFDLSDWACEMNTELYLKGFDCAIVSIGASSTGSTILSLEWSDREPYILIKENGAELVVGQSTRLHVSEVYYPEGNYTISWESSDPSVASVDQNGIVTALAGGDATIYASITDDQKDGAAITVLPPYQSAFDLEETVAGNALVLSWDRIRGVTEYQICKMEKGVETILKTVTENQATIDADLVSGDSLQVYVIARRVIQGDVLLTYSSEKLQIGYPEINYQCHLPDVLTRIEAYAFYNSGVTNVYIPSSVRSIGAYAFAECDNLYAIRLPSSVTSIGNAVFDDSDLEYVILSKNSYAHTYMVEHYPTVHLIFE